MKKKLLLALGAAAIAVGASAATYNLGEAFAYKIDPAFSFDLSGEQGELYEQYPAMGLQGQSSIEYGFGMASAWFTGKQFATAADANAWCPVVEDPWNAGSYVVRMQTTSWDGFGNFNFSIPQTNELSRVRVIYRVDPTGINNTWYSDHGQKSFKVKLMNDNDQNTPDYPEVEEYNEDFWNNPGWRVADFVLNLDSDLNYISLLWDAGGLSCGRNVPFYVKEVSVVPMSKLTGYTVPEEKPVGETDIKMPMSLTVVQEMPDLVTVVEDGATPSGMYVLGEGFCYDIDPTFSFDLTGADGELYEQYPSMGLQGQSSIDYGFGMASAWFNNMKYNTPDEANADCPIVADPWDAESWVLRMQTARWDGFGNFNFSIPQTDKLTRVRVIYRVDPTGIDNTWYNDNAQKPFRVKLMNDNDQDTPDYPEVFEYNEDFWTNPGWRIADFVVDLNSDLNYISLLWDAGGLSCGRKVPFYVKEVSAVPVDNLKEAYTIPEGQPVGDTDMKVPMSLTVVQELPALVKVDRNSEPGAGIDGIEGDANSVVINGIAGAVSVAGFDGSVEVYNLVGQLIAKANVNGDTEIAAPAGVAIVKAGNTVAKVIVR